MRMQKLTKHLYWRWWVAVQSYNAPSHQKYMPCWRMSNGKWRIFRGGWVIKWRTGSSASINGGCNSAGNFAPCSTPLFVHLQKRRQLLATPILMCLLKWMQRTRGTSKSCQKKADVMSTRRKLQQNVGRFQAIKYFIDTKEQTLPWGEVLFCDGEVDSDRERWPYEIFMSSWKRTQCVGNFFDFG